MSKISLTTWILTVKKSLKSDFMVNIKSGKLFIIILITLFSYGAFAQRNSPAVKSAVKGFRAAVAKINITPENSQQLVGYQERMSIGVNDSIFHRIIALDDGISQFLLVSTDICLISPVEYELMAMRLQSQFKISPMNFF